MILTKEQQAELYNASVPLWEWLEKHCHPHVTVIVDSRGAEVLEGLARVMLPHPPSMDKKCTQCGKPFDTSIPESNRSKLCETCLGDQR